MRKGAPLAAVAVLMATLLSVALGLSFIPSVSVISAYPQEDDAVRAQDQENPIGGDREWDAEIGPLPVVTVLKTSLLDFGYRELTFLIVQTEEEWQALWERVEGARPPTVDFEVHTVLVAHLGVRPSGGYFVEIVAAGQGLEGIVVQVEARAPGPTCSVTLALTHPLHIVKVPKTEGPFQFMLEQAVYSCVQ
ncbi:MAG: protease complex subunit PrcB family protein [Thermoplasmata archaeon]